MPTYEYACKSCGKHLEVQQSFTDDALTTCPTCEGALRKVFGNIAISFKGSGFYSTDNRSVAKSGPAHGGGDSSDGSSKSETSTDSKPSESAGSKPSEGGGASKSSDSGGASSGSAKSSESKSSDSGGGSKPSDSGAGAGSDRSKAAATKAGS